MQYFVDKDMSFWDAKKALPFQVVALDATIRSSRNFIFAGSFLLALVSDPF
jgi:hypothetical protein